MESPRPLLNAHAYSPAAQTAISRFFRSTVEEVKHAIENYRVVVIGMAFNPHVKKVCQALQKAQISYHYMEYGSYHNQWRRRLAIKLWSGWPTFPQVFVQGRLIGGNAETQAALADGSLTAYLEESIPASGAVYGSQPGEEVPKG